MHAGVSEWFVQQAGIPQRRFDLIEMDEKAPIALIAANETEVGAKDWGGRANCRMVRVEVRIHPVSCSLCCYFRTNAKSTWTDTALVV